MGYIRYVSHFIFFARSWQQLDAVKNTLLYNISAFLKDQKYRSFQSFEVELAAARAGLSEISFKDRVIVMFVIIHFYLSNPN